MALALRLATMDATKPTTTTKTFTTYSNKETMDLQEQLFRDGAIRVSCERTESKVWVTTATMPATTAE